MTADGKTNLHKATAAWHSSPPDWIVVAALECDRTSQSAVAKRLGVSPALLNQCLANTWESRGGRMDKIEQRVRGELMKETVRCPVLGEISRRECLDAQSRALRGLRTNAVRRELVRACPGCRHCIRRAA